MNLSYLFKLSTAVDNVVRKFLRRRFFIKRVNKLIGV